MPASPALGVPLKVIVPLVPAVVDAAVTLAGSAGVQAAVFTAGAGQPVALNATLPAIPTCSVPVAAPVNSGARLTSMVTSASDVPCEFAMR